MACFCAGGPAMATAGVASRGVGVHGARRAATATRLSVGRPVPRRSVRRAAAAADEGVPEPAKKGPSTNQMLVFVPPHPLIQHWLGIARNALTPPQVFRSCMGELGRLLIYECARDWLPTVTAMVDGPLGRGLHSFTFQLNLSRV